MKYLIFSDIHGSLSRVEKVIEAFKNKKCDRMIILGDVLYHGPRNPLPEGHNPKEVARRLNDYKEVIYAIRGNCDSEVDQMVLEFPCLGDYTIIVDEGTTLFATHGHLYHPEKLPYLPKDSVFFYGHTHLWEIKQKEGLVLCNPGSISLPKENRRPTYAIYEKGIIHIYDLITDELLQEHTL